MKNPKRFVGNLVLSNSCKFYYDDITVTSFINILWAKGLSANAIQSEMHPVYGDKCFRRSNKFARCWESVIDKKQPGRPVVTTDVTIPAVDTLVQSDQHVLIYGINVPINFDNMLKNETNVWRLDKTNVWCLDRLSCCLW